MTLIWWKASTSCPLNLLSLREVGEYYDSCTSVSLCIDIVVINELDAYEVASLLLDEVVSLSQDIYNLSRMKSHFLRGKTPTCK